MNVKIQSVKFDADKKLIDFIENKMAKLDRFVERAISVALSRLSKTTVRPSREATISLNFCSHPTSSEAIPI